LGGNDSLSNEIYKTLGIIMRHFKRLYIFVSQDCGYQRNGVFSSDKSEIEDESGHTTITIYERMNKHKFLMSKRGKLRSG